MFNDVCTLYNKYTESGIEKWQRTVLEGVYWNNIKGAVMRKTGATSVDSAVIIIPHSVKADFRKPKEWESLADKTDAWTLQSGDTIVKGRIDYEVIKSSRELQKFDDVYIITTIDDKAFGGCMAHWEVSAK